MTETERTLAQLDELAAMAWAHVERLHAQLMAEPDTRAFAQLARLYERAQRDLRATLALRGRVLRAQAAARRRAGAQARAAALQAFHDATPGPTRH